MNTIDNISIDEINDIAIAAGKIIMQIRNEGFKTQTKKDSYDFVTTADIKSEEYIFGKLSEKFPDDSILCEEGGKVQKNKSRVWMVDPLDGTKDFKNGGDGFSVMIGLCQDGMPILGAVYAPATDRLYFSEKGNGSYVRLNGTDNRLCVSSKKRFNDSIMVTRIPHGEKREEDRLTDYFNVKEKIPESSVGIKLGLIAENKADFHISSNARMSKWDTCAPQIILEEAGGKITDIYGNPLKYNQQEDTWSNAFVASNGALHESILEKIADFYS